MSDDEKELAPLTFNWSKDNGVILIPVDNGCQLIFRHSASLESILEGNRIANQPVGLDFVTDDEFNNMLTTVYQHNSMQSHKIMNAISDELDTYSFASELSDNEELIGSDNEAPIIRLINTILTEAIKNSASDIHVESFEKKLIIRFRIDGVLRNILELKRGVALLLVSRIKVMAKLDIAEKRIPPRWAYCIGLGRASFRCARISFTIKSW